MTRVHRSPSTSCAHARNAASHPVAPSGAHGLPPQPPVRQSTPMPNRRRLWRGILIAAIVVFLAAACALGAIAYLYWSGQQTYDSLAESAFSPDASLTDAEGDALSDLTVDWNALLAVNPDTVGWVYIPGTNVNYPIVKASADDPEKYLTYDFEGNKGGRWLPTYGVPFLLATNAQDFSDKNNIVQGHHLQNGEMFAAIADFADSEQFNAHRNVYLLTPQGNYRLRSAALVHCQGSEPIAQTQFASDDDFAAYVQDKLDRSIVSADGEVPAATDVSRLFMFSTCDSTQDARYVLYCVPVEFAPAGSSSSVMLDGSQSQSNAQDGAGGANAVDPAAASNIDDAAKEIVS